VTAVRPGRIIRLAALALPAALCASATDRSSAQPAGPRVEFPRDFRTGMAHYATVDRADGKVYELYVNEAALAGWQRFRPFPEGAVFAIESFLAERNADGSPRTGAGGRLVKGRSENEIHVSAKRSDWPPDGECSGESLMQGQPAGSGRWRVGAFDPRDGKRIERASHPPGECVQCHTDRRGEDFLLSAGLLDTFRRTRQTVYFRWTQCGERDICFGGPPKPLSSPLPSCEATFRP
jgi:hypothetical protein